MYTLWMKKEKEIPLTYSVIKKLLEEQGKEFNRYVHMVAEEYQERLKVATELIPDMYRDVQILKEDVSELKDDVSGLKHDMKAVKNRLNMPAKVAYWLYKPPGIYCSPPEYVEHKQPTIEAVLDLPVGVVEKPLKKRFFVSSKYSDAFVDN